MFCAAKFAPIPSTRFNGDRSSKKQTREKAAFRNADTHTISKSPKVVSGVHTKPKTLFSDTTELGPKKPQSGYEVWSGYEALVDLSELFTPIHPDTPMPHETPYELTPEDIAWMNWTAPDTHIDSYECVSNSDWDECPAIMPGW